MKTSISASPASLAAVRWLALALLLVPALLLSAAEEFTLETARAAAAKDDAKAQYFLGRCYAKGDGVALDYAKAAEWYWHAAKSGHASAQYYLGGLYYRGQGVKKDQEEALKWYTKAAEQGDRRAQYCAGRAYAYGLGAPKDGQQAVKWYTMAAEQNQPDALEELGIIYLLGDLGIKRDYTASAKWLRQAAGQGRAAALNGLGQLCELGQVGDLKLEHAAGFYRKAAEKGLARAAIALGRLYLDGEGVKQDKVEAFAWFTLASRKGDDMAGHYLKEMEGHNLLSAEDKQTAERRIQEITDSCPALSPEKERPSPPVSAK